MTTTHDKLVAAARATVKAHQTLLAQCHSNPIMNAWGQSVSVFDLNEAQQLADEALKLLDTSAASTPADGGPVHPTLTRVGSAEVSEGGMSLRDHFAGLALQGYLASFQTDSEPAEFATIIATDCYKLADAMLAARQIGGAS